MNERTKQAIRDHAHIMGRNLTHKDCRIRMADVLATFVNAAYGLAYDKDSDSFAVLWKACHTAIWEATQPR